MRIASWNGRRTVVQLEEAKRFILDGEVARLRLALILLDNAVEVMLHRRVSEDLGRANMYARMLQRFPGGPLDGKGEALRQEIAAAIISPARQKKVARYFGQKLTVLSQSGQLPFATTRALRHLHDYRNELQHHDHVRPESIRPAALVLFDIALDLVVTLGPARRPGAVTTIFAAELRGAFIPHTPAGASRIEVLVQYQLPCFLKTRLLLVLQRAHASEGAEMLPERRWAHVREIRQIIPLQRLREILLEPADHPHNLMA